MYDINNIGNIIITWKGNTEEYKTRLNKGMVEVINTEGHVYVHYIIDDFIKIMNKGNIYEPKSELFPIF